ncbi:MAG: zf-TFIIB domain-containing protein [Myxococcales bacterium]|nr:zf-TFIIB domain-containing protein [Myxococcales bacterium]
MLMRCENCGAPQEFDELTQVTECDYCGQNNFVQRPGETRTSASPEHCPGCGYRLFGARTSNGFIWGCGHCGGVWLDLANCKTLAAGSNTEVVEMAKRAAGNARLRGQDAKVPRACPVCDERMHMTPILGGIRTVDACPQHGSFFDPGEIQELHRSFDAYANKPARQTHLTPSRRDWNHTPATDAELAAFAAAVKKPNHDDADVKALFTGGVMLLSILAAASDD